MRQKLRRASSKLSFALSSVLLLATGLTSGVAHASSAAYAATDVYGQLTAGNQDFTTDNSGTSDSEFNYADGTALDTVHHRLFVSDENNNRVLEFALNSDNSPASRHAEHVLGQTTFSGTGSSNSQSGLSEPYAGLAYDSVNDRLFVSDDGNRRVVVYNLANGISDGMNASYELGQSGWGVTSGALTQAGISSPEGVAFDPTHELLFVSDYSNDRVTVYNVAPGSIQNGENATHVLGQADFTHRVSATTQNGMAEPEALAYNPTTQQLFVGDSENYRVLVFDLSNGITDHMNASFVLGEPDFQTTNSTSRTVAQNTMGEYEEGLGIDTVHNILYQYDDAFNRILVFNLAGGITNGMDANMVIGQTDFTSSDYSCNPSATTLCDSEGNISVDPATGRLFVPDADFERVLVFQMPHTTAPTGSALTVSAGNNVTLNLSTTGTLGTVTYAITSGTLPPGLTLNASTGVISGKATQAGTFTFDVTTTDNLGTIGSFVEDPTVTVTVTSGAPNTGFGEPHSDTGAALLILTGLAGLAFTLRRYRQKA